MSRGSQPKKSLPPMPGNVRAALVKRDLMDAFRTRPDYQQADYLKWIAAANGEVTKQKRLDQMLDELANGALYQGQPWEPPAPVAKTGSSPRST